MMAVLISGSLVRDPVERTAANGSQYVTALLRVPVEDGDPVIASLICFSKSEVAPLIALKTGDALAIAGRAKLSEWTKDGQTKHGLSVVADRVMTAYEAGKKRKAAREEGAQ